MRIAIDTIPLLSPRTGVGNYILQLVRYFNRLAPENEYTYYYGCFTRRLLQGNRRTYDLKDALWKVPIFRYSLRQAKNILTRFHLREFDLYFEPNFIPLSIRAKKIVATVHDFSFHLYPQWHPKDRIGYMQKNFFPNITRSNRIITDSVYIKDEALDILKLSNTMVSPIHLGVEQDIFKIYEKRLLEAYKNDMGLPENFILFVGTIEPRKNLKRLLHAYLELPESTKREFKLVLAGFEGWNNDAFATILPRLGSSAIYLGYMATKELSYLYNLASLFVFPSLYEGFGLPPLEAMACGCPVVVSNAASLPEVCGDGAYYVDPYDISNIAEGMQKVLTDEELRRSLVKKGAARVKLFSWEKTAKETLKVFADVLDG